MRLNLSTRLTLLSLVVIGCFSTRLLAQDAGTYMVQDGASPWSDRVGSWELGDVPDSLKSSAPLPQQLCASRTLTVADKPKSILIGVSVADLPAFKAKFPQATETGDKFTVRHPTETKGIPYAAVLLPDPPETVGGDTPFGAGLVLLKADASAQAATAPATKP